MREDIMDSIRKLKKQVIKTADSMGQKTDEFVELQKIRSRQHALEDSAEEIYLEIGRKIYAAQTAGKSYGEEIDSLCDAVTRLLQDIEKCKAEIAERKGLMTCPNCGASVPDNASFCMKCGMPVVKSKKAENEEKSGDSGNAEENSERKNDRAEE